MIIRAIKTVFSCVRCISTYIDCVSQRVLSERHTPIIRSYGTLAVVGRERVRKEKELRFVLEVAELGGIGRHTRASASAAAAAAAAAVAAAVAAKRRWRSGLSRTESKQVRRGTESQSRRRRIVPQRVGVGDGRAE
jgi:hypothetical protein